MQIFVCYSIIRGGRRFPLLRIFSPPSSPPKKYFKGVCPRVSYRVSVAECEVDGHDEVEPEAAADEVQEGRVLDGEEEAQLTQLELTDRDLLLKTKF